MVEDNTDCYRRNSSCLGFERRHITDTRCGVLQERKEIIIVVTELLIK